MAIWSISCPLWFPDATTQRLALVDNPAALYGFEADRRLTAFTARTSSRVGREGWSSRSAAAR